MPTRTNRNTGEVQEMQPDGSWKTIVPPQNAGPTTIQVRGPNQLLPAQKIKANNDAAASAYAPGKAASEARIATLEARIKSADAAVATAKNDTELKTAQVNLEKTRAELEQLKGGKGSALNALQSQVDRVQNLYQNNLQGGLPNVVNSVVPDFLQPGKAQFDSAAQGLTNPFQAAFKVQGQGSQSDTELRQFLQSNVPSQGDSDAVIEEKLRNIQTRIDAERGNLGQKAPPPPDQADQFGLSGGSQNRDEIDPALKATGTKVGQMLSNGTPDGKILKFLRDSGVDPTSTSIMEQFKFRKSPDFRTWQRQNPGAAYPIGPSFYTKQVPVSGARRLFNKAAATNAGGALSAGLASSANAISGGRLDDAVGALSGDPAMAQTGMDLLRTQHPVASVAGDLAGQASLEAAAGLVPGAQGLMATRYGRRGADLAYGAYSGSGENNDNPLEGALTGALTNAGFGMAGRGAQRSAGRALTGVRNAHLGYLNSQDVPLTIGQIGRGSESELGRAVGGIEERAMGLPGLDAIIGTARKRGDKAFNSAAFRQMPGHSGETGAAGIAEGRGLVDNAYNFLDPVTLPLDAQFAGSQAGVRAALPGLPAFGPQIGKSLDMIDKASANGALTGREWQSALRAAKGNKASLRGKEFSDDAQNVLGDVENNLQGLAARQGPPDTAAQLTSANQLNTKFQTLSSALDNGPAQKADELFSAGRLDDASRVNARNFGGRTASLTGNRPFYELSTAGKAVMPNLTPDSGTAGRMLLVPALTGLGGAGVGFANGDDNDKGGSSLKGLGYGALAAAALSAPYSKGGQKVIQKALLGKRRAGMVKLGDYLINNPRLAGLLASAIGRDYVYQPELPEQ